MKSLALLFGGNISWPTVGLVLALSGVSTGLGIRALNSDSAEGATARVEAVEQKIMSLASRLDQVEARLGFVEKRLEKLEASVAELAVAVGRLQTDISWIRDRLARTR